MRREEFASGYPGKLVEIPGGHAFVPEPLPPEHVPQAVENLVNFMAGPSAYPPLVAAGIAHYQFEAIHPFEDGNGRLGRLLIPLQLMAAGVITQPLVYLSPYFEAHRDTYLRLLKRVSTDGAWGDWLAFFLEAVHLQAGDARSRVERIQALEKEYRTRASQVRSKVPAYVVGYVMEQVIVTVKDIADAARCNYHTAKAAIDTLVRFGVLEPMPDMYPQRWWAAELVRQVYEG